LDQDSPEAEPGFGLGRDSEAILLLMLKRSPTVCDGEIREVFFGFAYHIPLG